MCVARTSLGAFSEDDFYSFAPALVNADEFPFDLGCDVAQQYVGCGMDVQGWRDQVQQRLFGGQGAFRKISEAGELFAAVMPCHSGPVIEALEWKVDIFVGFEFYDCRGDLRA